MPQPVQSADHSSEVYLLPEYWVSFGHTMSIGPQARNSEPGMGGGRFEREKAVPLEK